MFKMCLTKDSNVLMGKTQKNTFVFEFSKAQFEMGSWIVFWIKA